MIRPTMKAFLWVLVVAVVVGNCFAMLPADSQAGDNPVSVYAPSATEVEAPEDKKSASLTADSSSQAVKPPVSLHKSCKTDADCGPYAKCDATSEICSCIQGAIPASTTSGQNADNVSAGCMLLSKLGDSCQNDDECRLGNRRLICLAPERKCHCDKEFTVEGDDCVPRTTPVEPIRTESASDRPDRVFGSPANPKADHIYNDPELVRERRRFTAAGTTTPHLAPSSTVTIVVVVGFTLLFAGLCVAAYVKCKSMMRENNGGNDGQGRGNQSGQAGRRSAYAASLSSSTSTSHYTTDTLNSASTSGSTSRVLGGSRNALAKKLKFWSRQRREEPRLTISVLGQIYEKEWAMHRGKTLAAAAAAEDQYAPKEFDDSASSSCCQEDDDQDMTDCERQHRDVFLPPDIAYYISELPNKQDSRKPSAISNGDDSVVVPQTPPPTAVSAKEETDEETAAKQ